LNVAIRKGFCISVDPRVQASDTVAKTTQQRRYLLPAFSIESEMSWAIPAESIPSLKEA